MVPNDHSCLTFSYHGPSMAGTFREGDILLIQPAELTAIRVGDVVAVRKCGPDGTAALVAHRVRAQVPAGLITQGDLSPGRDASPVTAADLVGRVHSIIRGNDTHQVWGGVRGLLWAGCLRLCRQMAKLMRRPYRLLRSSGVVRRVWRLRLTRVHLITREGIVVKYVEGKSTVAQWWPETNDFRCRQPYDLVVERPAEVLPKPINLAGDPLHLPGMPTELWGGCKQV